MEQGLHVVQLWVLHNERAEEVLVVYPPDGYWRARPLPPAHMRWTAYGSSFLVGPVEVQERPIVDLKDISFDPETKTFTMNFARGGSAKLTVDTLDQDRIILDISYDGPMAGGTAVHGDALHVHHRVQRRRGPGRVAHQGRQGLGRKPDHELPGRRRPPNSGRAEPPPPATTPARPTWCSTASRPGRQSPRQSPRRSSRHADAPGYFGASSSALTFANTARNISGVRRPVFVL